MTGTLDPIAVYAAVVGTLALGWDVFKWWSGDASFAIKIGTNMIDPTDPEPRKPKLAFEVSNRGKTPTTITHIVVKGYRSVLHRFVGRAAVEAFIPRPGITAVPYELQPGGRFIATSKQTDQIVGWSQNYKLYGGVYHSHSKRPLLARIRPLKPSE